MSDCDWSIPLHSMIMTTAGIQCRKCGWVSVRAKPKVPDKK